MQNVSVFSGSSGHELTKEQSYEVQKQYMFLNRTDVYDKRNYNLAK